MVKRHELINKLIEENGFKKYLEIGIDNPDNCFNKVVCEKKIGVDPYSDTLETHIWTLKNRDDLKEKIGEEWYEMTSDEFFKKKRNKFDIIFIDGLHMEEQIDRDIENSLSRLNKGGMILLHDMLPRTKEVQTYDPQPGVPWMGNGYRSFWKLRMERKDLDLYTLDIETGISVIKEGKNDPYKAKNFKGNMSFAYFKLHYKEIMNVVNAPK